MTRMPVSSASSPELAAELAAGSIATTILARFGAAAWRAASIIDQADFLAALAGDEKN